MTRLLFVDDDEHILQGLRRMMHRRLHDSVAHYVRSGAEALALLEEHPFDVLITDMRMPKMDGAELLHAVHRRYPSMVRIVLSGQTDLEAVVRAAPFAHRVLAKPCSQSKLYDAIERTSGAYRLLGCEELVDVVGGIISLPSVPGIFHGLVDPKAESDLTERVARASAEDPALAAKLLQLSNSAFFTNEPVCRLEDAAASLGSALLGEVLRERAFSHAFGEHEGKSGFDIVAYQRRAVLSSQLVGSMLDSASERAEGMLAGLLYDIGRLLIAASLPSQHRAIVEMHRERGVTERDAERRILGVTHAELGACLLGLWGLPNSIVEATLHHHARFDGKSQRLDVVSAVRLAELILTEPSRCEVPLPFSAVPGIDDRFDAWRRMGQQLQQEYRG